MPSNIPKRPLGRTLGSEEAAAILRKTKPSNVSFRRLGSLAWLRFIRWIRQSGSGRDERAEIFHVPVCGILENRIDGFWGPIWWRAFGRWPTPFHTLIIASDILVNNLWSFEESNILFNTTCSSILYICMNVFWLVIPGLGTLSELNVKYFICTMHSYKINFLQGYVQVFHISLYARRVNRLM